VVGVPTVVVQVLPREARGLAPSQCRAARCHARYHLSEGAHLGDDAFLGGFVACQLGFAAVLFFGAAVVGLGACAVEAVPESVVVGLGAGAGRFPLFSELPDRVARGSQVGAVGRALSLGDDAFPGGFVACPLGFAADL